jgi:hypothetical protein
MLEGWLITSFLYSHTTVNKQEISAKLINDVTDGFELERRKY